MQNESKKRKSRASTTNFDIADDMRPPKMIDSYIQPSKCCFNFVTSLLLPGKILSLLEH